VLNDAVDDGFVAIFSREVPGEGNDVRAPPETLR
jgi:hypothetical protein